ncbi:Sec-dependent nitrous-oxide reductase [candidate division KSB1 bacterium]|nr:Sec-dependent nitrous-oxide reductase [candidate division KSB1 bacterium]NIR73476.1 Sec-dependent nitrous-oxide reductase [candidate division KSB1 bacterium]NIS25280.1 Sec-dependent nitrous-oxide reductase [candidate division KSB1 bacterium]NIT72184.1 Sec-dependent nitrous-oxide reductase [candidate division KSB1 bacterium]NIU26002.1 Sec-dependent nitrous-oxide reductase [candidate division KSB1 bacterium]
MKVLKSPFTWIAVMLIALIVGLSCGEPEQQRGRAGARSDVAQAALKTYVQPGDLDEYYIFYSGGHSGNVYVAGIPSMRHIATLPVFTPYPATGYGFDKESKEMLGGFTWGDAHHPAISETAGDYDGRWLFINDNANNRVARIDLRDFKTKEIFGPIPNLSGNHGSSFVTPNTEYVLIASRFSIPIPKGTAVSVNGYAEKYNGIVAGVKVDPNSGEMSHGFQIKMPPFNYDLGDCGKGMTDGWAFWSCYNSERATGKLEVTASQNDRDYIAAVNWRAAEKAIADGNFDMIGGVKIIDPEKVKGIVHFLPCAKSPHGVDVSPSGQWIVGNGKLQSITTVYNIEKIKQAIANEDFVGEEDGVPVLNYDSIKEAEVEVGLGPLHTQFDADGNAYTSLFVESAIAKWRVGTWDVVDKIPVSYNIGHLAAAEGDSRNPDGKYLVALNKLSKGRHLSVGPSQPESSQLIDISGEKMQLLYDAFTEPEPHYAQIIKADKLEPIEVYPKEENTNPNAIWDVKDASVTREGNHVSVKMLAVRTNFQPDNFEVRKGDKVTVYLTNIEQTTDELHGFAINEYNLNIVADPGETKVIEFVADKEGVYPFYCTNFCSALHQEMQGYMVVHP